MTGRKAPSENVGLIWPISLCSLLDYLLKTKICIQWTVAIPCWGYSVPPHKRNTNLRVGDEITPLYSPSCTFCNSCTLRDISSRPVPTCSALNSLCIDIRLQGVCASIPVRISRLRTSPAQDGIAPINLQRETATVASSALLFRTEGTVPCVK